MPCTCKVSLHRLQCPLLLPGDCEHLLYELRPELSTGAQSKTMEISRQREHLSLWGKEGELGQHGKANCPWVQGM